MTMEDIVNYSKQYGFIFQGSEIYGGLANTWDYGPLGALLKDNIKNAWKKKFIQESKLNVGLKNEFVQNSRLSLTYSVDGTTIMSSDIFNLLPDNQGNVVKMTIEEIEESLDYTDVSKYLQSALKETKEEFYQIIQHDIDYRELDAKIMQLRDEYSVYEYLDRKNEPVKNLIGIYEGIRKMLKNMQMSVESILFVEILESE